MGSGMRVRSRFTLRALMEQESVSLGQLAAAVGVHRSFISHLVSGRSSGARAEIAERIAAVLCVPVDVLFAPRSAEAGPRKAVREQIEARRVPADPWSRRTH